MGEQSGSLELWEHWGQEVDLLVKYLDHLVRSEDADMFR